LSVCLPLLWQSTVGLQLCSNGKTSLEASLIKLHFSKTR
jgi:hypothetical protein